MRNFLISRCLVKSFAGKRLFPVAMLFSLFLVELAWAAGGNTLPDFTQLVKDNHQAVVNISTVRNGSKLHSENGKGHKFHDFPDIPAPYDDLLRRFFGDPDEHGEIPEFDTQSLGSGFIISSDGFVLTNNHVVKDADQILVRLNDRREFEAELIGIDERSDIAVLRIDAPNDLPTLRIGKSADLEVGEWVAAIGSPFGFDHSVTVGVVSAKGRMLPNESYVPFIQTDVAINPGNSGGPLFNLDGQVVGINSQIFSRTGGYMGVSFAIPIDVAMDVVQQLKTKGRVSRGWLGVYIQEITKDLADSFDMDSPLGALVSQVIDDGPADKGGIKVGDVIVEFDGSAVQDPSSLPPLVGKTPVGEKIKVKVIRNGKSKTLKITIEELPEQTDNEGKKSPKRSPFKDNRLGVVVKPLDDEMRTKLELDQYGVLVTRVGDGPARDAGIRRGDVIVMINGRYIEDAENLEKTVKDLPSDESVPILIHRGSGQIFLALKLTD